jgi:hypothetical protein
VTAALGDTAKINVYYPGTLNAQSQLNNIDRDVLQAAFLLYPRTVTVTCIRMRNARKFQSFTGQLRIAKTRVNQFIGIIATPVFIVPSLRQYTP